MHFFFHHVPLGSFAFYAPKLDQFYAENMDALFKKNPQLCRNFPKNAFPAATVPSTVVVEFTPYDISTLPMWPMAGVPYGQVVTLIQNKVATSYCLNLA